MNHNFNTFIAKEFGLEEAIILENIYFWCKKNEANGKLTNGKPWTYNSVKAFNQLFDYLTPAKISRALKNLENAGLIEVGNFNTNSYDRTKWYCTTDKAKNIFEPKNTPVEENKKSIFDSKESICENKKWNPQNSEMNLTDINTSDKPNENTNVVLTEEVVKEPVAKSKKFQDLKKQEKIQILLDSLSEQDTLNFKKCMTTFFEFKKKLDPKFNRRKEQLLEWEYEFVSFSKTSERSSEEILNTLTFTLSDQYWSKYMFAPKNFINKYETLFQQFVMKNKSYKPFTPQDKQPKRAVPSSQYL